MTIKELNKFAQACIKQADKTSDPKKARELASEALNRAGKRDK